VIDEGQNQRTHHRGTERAQSNARGDSRKVCALAGGVVTHQLNGEIDFPKKTTSCIKQASFFSVRLNFFVLRGFDLFMFLRA